MIVVTTPFVAGHRITESKGMVFGLVVRSRGLGGNLMAELRSLGGGEIHEYTSLLEDSRRQALDRLIANATLLGAQRHPLDALRQLVACPGSMSEIVAYGTAVIVVARRVGRSSHDAGVADGRRDRDRPPPHPHQRRDPRRHRSAAHRAARVRRHGRRASFCSCSAAALIVGALIERMRYRSDAVDRSSHPVGPGGGEPLDSALEPRFAPTEEVFVDPTSGHRMRVFMDASHGRAAVPRRILSHLTDWDLRGVRVQRALVLSSPAGAA